MSQALPLTYVDALCELDLDAFAAETSSDLQNLAQDLFHVLIEERGTNLDDPDRGVGVFSLLSGTVANLATVARRVDDEFLKDDRVSSCKTSIAQTGDSPPSYRFDIVVGVGSQVLPLSYAWDPVGGLRVIS